MDVVKASLWKTISLYMPELVNDHWPEGPAMVKIGVQELQDQDLGSGFPGMKSNAIAQSIAHEFVMSLIQLRNDICHPGKNYTPKQTAAMDQLYGRCQKVAIELHDRDSAIKSRDIRNRLRGEAQESDEQFSSKLRSQTPDTIWELPDERLFYNALRGPRDYPRVILKAAKIWNQGGHRLSKGFPESGHISDDDDYRRVPGQNDEYFRRLNMARFDTDSPDYEYGKRLLTFSALPLPNRQLPKHEYSTFRLHQTFSVWR